MSEEERDRLKKEAEESIEKFKRQIQSTERRSLEISVQVVIARLEATVEHVERDTNELRSDMKDVRDRLVRLETKVDELPPKGYVVTVVLATAAVLAVLSVFQQQVQTLLGLSGS